MKAGNLFFYKNFEQNAKNMQKNFSGELTICESDVIVSFRTRH